MIKWLHSNPFLLMEITRRIEKKEYGKTMALKDIMGEEKKNLSLIPADGFIAKFGGLQTSFKSNLSIKHSIFHL